MKGVTDELKKEMQSLLQELSKHSAAACRVILAADQALLHLDDGELLQMNLQRLKAIAQEGEEVNKYQMDSFDLVMHSSEFTYKYVFHLESKSSV